MIIAITGKIASGKSLAAKFLSSISDIPCFDVDALSKVYMAENSEYISDICAQYGAVQPFEYETFIKDNIFNIKPFQNEIEGFCKNKLQEHLNRLEEKYGYVIIELFHIPLKFLPNIDVIIHVDCSDDIRSKRMVAFITVLLTNIAFGVKSHRQYIPISELEVMKTERFIQVVDETGELLYETRDYYTIANFDNYKFIEKNMGHKSMELHSMDS